MVAPTNSGLLRTKSRSSRHSENRPAPKPVRSTRLSQSEGMIWSVSTSVRSRGTARPVTTTTGFIGRGPPGWRTSRRLRWRRRRRARRGGCGRRGPGDPRSCGSRSRRSARPTASLSGFMARHMEQPGSRHSKPAAMKILSSPSASAWALTRCEPGHDQRPQPGVDRAALEHGGGGPEVLDARVRARARGTPCPR